MPAPTLTVTEENMLTALRGFLIAVTAAQTEVVVGQDNLVAEPLKGDFIVMTPIMAEQLETTVNTYFDGYSINVPGQLSILHPEKVTVQLDIHGPNSFNNKTAIVTLFRSEFGINTFHASGFDVTPLYTNDARQIPFLNGEQQTEKRWIVEAVLQSNPVVQVGQDFATTLKIGLINVDEAYPPH